MADDLTARVAALEGRHAQLENTIAELRADSRSVPLNSCGVEEYGLAMRSTLFSVVCVLVFAASCKSGSGGESGMPLKTDTPACKKAMTCCTKMVEVTKGKATPDDINLSCSGVALAGNDSECDQFRQGFAMSIEGAEKTVPAECK